MITIGVLTPHAAAGPEAELPDMAPGHVVTRRSRILAEDDDVASPRTPPTSPSGLSELTAPAALDRAAAAFSGAPIDAIGYASTSTAYAIGSDAEATMVRGLSQRWSLPVASTSLAAIAALQSLGVQRMALVHPPWFADELNALGATYFSNQGFRVVSAASADLPHDPRDIEPGAVVEWIAHNVGDDAEAVFIGGTGFRAVRAIAPLELRLRRPVLESNQVLLWAILAQLDARCEVRGYGRLFEDGP